MDSASAFADDRGEPLTGAHRYVIHFEKRPPVDAFWALSMYDATNDSFVENSLDRYAIGDRTPDLRYNADGSLDLYLQHASPGGEQEANWLPNPAGAFHVTLRMYQPHGAVLDGRYVLPPKTCLPHPLPHTFRDRPGGGAAEDQFPYGARPAVGLSSRP